MFPLGLMAIGESAEIVGNIRFGDQALRSGHCDAGGKCREGSVVRIEDMGIRPGKTVEMLNNEAGGALLVKIDEARIAVGRAMAMKIMVMVRRKSDEPGNAEAR